METIKNDTFVLGGKEFHSRFILGSGKFSQQLIRDVMEYGGSEIATIALRRANADSPENILDYLPENLTLLPNTSGARNADEAVLHCPSFPCTGLRRFCKSGSHSRYEVPAPRQCRNHSGNRNFVQRGLPRIAIHVP